MSGGGGSGDDYEVSINLTAMLDVLTNLLFFLMFGFAAQQSSIELEGKVELPTSTAELPPKKAINVSVGQEDLRVDKEVVAQVKSGKIVGIEPDGRIEVLYRRLVAIREQRVTGASKDPDSDDVLFVLADRNTPYSTLRRVLSTGAEAGFPRFRMAVLMQ
jgi:biopolymer transport protein ExbD